MRKTLGQLMYEAEIRRWKWEIVRRAIYLLLAVVATVALVIMALRP